MSLQPATVLAFGRVQRRPAAVRPRTKLFRALGASDPPRLVEIQGRTYRRVEVFKHDSWAATALYVSGRQRIVCKFNRRQSAFGLPMQWLGCWLARREARLLKMLSDVPGIPAVCGAVRSAGQELPYAVARHYVPGQPLRHDQHLPQQFFDRLRELLTEVHRRRLAYVDLHKRENILVGEDGLPYLFDFQISFALPRRGWSRLLPLGRVLTLLQRSDNYHFLKHYASCRPDLCGLTREQLAGCRPWWIRLHRIVAQPLRTLRRRLLVWLRIRSGSGRAESECFTEVALRRQV